MKKTKELKKNQKGVTMISLIVVILLLVVIAAVTVSTSLDRFEINKIQKMYNDIKLLSEKVSNYYLKYNGLPVLRDAREGKIEYNYTQIKFETNVNDSDVYYIIDLEAMDGIAINYGKEGFENPNTTDDVYIINEASHSIYYVKGVEVDGEVYHTIPSENVAFEDITNSTKPQIKIVRGEKATLGQYISPVVVEIIPGKNNASNIERTTVIINSDKELDISELENNMITLEDDGIYTITAKSYTNGGNVATTSLVIDKTNHSDVLIPTVEATGVFANNANIAEVREGNVPIPTGFQYVKGDVIGGVVITDAASSTATDGNEFVWVPVDNVIDIIMCKTDPKETLNTVTYQCPICGEDTEWAGKLYSSQTGDNFTPSKPNLKFYETMGLREPINLTKEDFEDSTARLSEWTPTLYQERFNSMIESVAKYHGFYVSRYEMSLTSDINATAQSKKNKTTANNTNTNSRMWWGLYSKAETYVMNSVTSEMIWGSQYDAMMRWMYENGVDITQTIPQDITGNSTEKNTSRITGSKEKDKLCNIYDLLGNSQTWTQEGSGTMARTVRGGSHNYDRSPSYRGGYGSNVTSVNTFGTRISLNIK